MLLPACQSNEGKGMSSFQFTVTQLHDMLIALRMRRDLDMPNGEDLESGRARSSANQRRKRKLIDFKVNSFQKWPAGQAIPYMFDGTHSEYRFKISVP